jgi:hypothetical protein
MSRCTVDVDRSLTLALSSHCHGGPEVHRRIKSASTVVGSDIGRKYVHGLFSSLLLLVIVATDLILEPLRVVGHHEHVAVVRQDESRGVQVVLQGRRSKGESLVAAHIHPFA